VGKRSRDLAVLPVRPVGAAAAGIVRTTAAAATTAIVRASVDPRRRVNVFSLRWESSRSEAATRMDLRTSHPNGCLYPVGEKTVRVVQSGIVRLSMSIG
jgi:hypothetical protein